MKGKKYGVMLFLTTVLFLISAWQLDILCANLLFPVKEARFYYWFGSLSNWSHYALCFWLMGFAFFAPVILFIVTMLTKENGIKVSVDLNPSLPQYVIFGILIFLEALIIPAYAVLTQNRMPSEIEWLTFFFGALLQLITYLMSKVKFKKEGVAEK